MTNEQSNALIGWGILGCCLVIAGCAVWATVQTARTIRQVGDVSAAQLAEIGQKMQTEITFEGIARRETGEA